MDIIKERIKWKHINVRPETFDELMALKDKNIFKSNDDFQKELIKIYRRTHELL